MSGLAFLPVQNDVTMTMSFDGEVFEYFYIHFFFRVVTRDSMRVSSFIRRVKRLRRVNGFEQCPYLFDFM